MSHKLSCEFHCHTEASYDGFTSISDLITELGRKRIDLVAITEHDRIALHSRDRARFERAGIQVIQGCEMTTANGSHIIGLFVDSCVTGRPTRETVDHILQQGGLVYIPHPFKPGSGLLALAETSDPDVQYALEAANMLELHNGGWNASAFSAEIRAIADRFGIQLVAGSDSHRPWEVGYYRNELTVDRLPVGAQELKTARIEGFSRCVGARSASAPGGPERRLWSRLLQQQPWYQEFVSRVPWSAKRAIKKIHYSRQLRDYRRTEATLSYAKLG
ncbi:MAG: PHP domain-containing protein [Myxococcales bacterium FL481]|nr:MAG: PHP domain-containing protein [Myxococcales bacterium FL481]